MEWERTKIEVITSYLCEIGQKTQIRSVQTPPNSLDNEKFPSKKLFIRQGDISKDCILLADRITCRPLSRTPSKRENRGKEIRRDVAAFRESQPEKMLSAQTCLSSFSPIELHPSLYFCSSTFKARARKRRFCVSIFRRKALN